MSRAGALAAEHEHTLGVCASTIHTADPYAFSSELPEAGPEPQKHGQLHSVRPTLVSSEHHWAQAASEMHELTQGSASVAPLT